MLLYDPFGVAMAFWYNTLEQAQAESIDMTIASEKVVASARSAGIITTSRMTADRSWIPTVEHLHSALYLLSLVVIAVLLVLPGRLGGGLSRGLRAFALFLLLGILANAFVCGGVSQPATRYGARVIWLLPYLATLMAVMAWSRRGAARTP